LIKEKYSIVFHAQKPVLKVAPLQHNNRTLNTIQCQPFLLQKHKITIKFHIYSPNPVPCKTFWELEIPSAVSAKAKIITNVVPTQMVWANLNGNVNRPMQ